MPYLQLLLIRTALPKRRE